jgi:GNAT superfamily N-acetyltransferase
MGQIRVLDVIEETLEDLCWLCVPEDRRQEAAFARGVALKKAWVREKLRLWGRCAKLAYVGCDAAGLLQYEPVPQERVIRIHCVFVPDEAHWRKGIARRLLSSLLTDAGQAQGWFGGEPARALVTRTFSGELPGQYPARRFFVRMGFGPADDDPDLLWLPLHEAAAYRAAWAQEAAYIPQAEDAGTGLLLYGPSFCPFSYVFLERAARAIQAVAPGLPIRWINRLEEPGAYARRGGYAGCVVNAQPIQAFVLDQETFEAEVAAALGASIEDTSTSEVHTDRKETRGDTR